jgi:molybdate transport system ATP-binding protein
LGANGTHKSLVVNAISAGFLGGHQIVVDDKENENGHHPFLTDAAALRFHSARPAVARVSFESQQSLLANGARSVYSALTPYGGVLGKAAQFLAVRFGLYGLLASSVQTLSTGEIRKVLLIRALSTRPDLLIMDNALDGLDVQSREIVKDLVAKTIAGFRTDILVQGVSTQSVAQTQVLFTTHRPEEIVDGIGRVTLMNTRTENSDCGGGGGEVVVTLDRQGRSGEELLAMACPGVDETLKPWEDDTTLPTNDEVVELWFRGNKNTNDFKDCGMNYDVDDHGGDDCIVQVNNFTVTRNERDLLSTLNWTVRHGERWLVAGRNGSGKSTLSRLVVQQHQHPDGKGASPTEPDGSVHVRVQSIGWVSTERHMSMAQSQLASMQVLLGAHEQKKLDDTSVVDAEIGKTVASWLNLDQKVLGRPFANLSQGEQKLVLIGNAIAQRPSLLIIDEPLQGLDLKNRRLVLGLVERICSSTRTSLMYMTHHFEEIVPSITHVLHLKEGRSVFNDRLELYDPARM